jgi:hypothetical protein
VKAKEIKGKAQSREAMLEFLTTTTAAIDMQYPVDISITTDTGVRKCQAVFWIWMKDITKHLRNTWPNHYSALNPNGTDMHDKVCQWFLGMTKAKKFGREVTAPMQKTLTSPKMSTGEMIDLLRRIEEWAISQNIPLNQERSEYTEAR